MAPRLEMSRGRYQQNIAALQRRLAPSQLMVVMKDDAYGHGVEWAVDAAVAAAIPVDLFGGYDVSTALRIRARAPQARIFVWVTSSDDEVRTALASDIDLGVGTLSYLRRIVTIARELRATARVHLKIDTGLHRNGVRPEEWPAFVAEAMTAQADGVIEVVGVWSHLAEASDAEDDDAAAEFDRAVKLLESAGAPGGAASHRLGRILVAAGVARQRLSDRRVLLWRALCRGTRDSWCGAGGHAARAGDRGPRR